MSGLFSLLRQPQVSEPVDIVRRVGVSPLSQLGLKYQVDIEEHKLINFEDLSQEILHHLPREISRSLILPYLSSFSSATGQTLKYYYDSKFNYRNIKFIGYYFESEAVIIKVQGAVTDPDPEWFFDPTQRFCSIVKECPS